METTIVQQTVLLGCPQSRHHVVSTSEARSHVDFEFSLHHIVRDYHNNVLLTRTVQRNVITKSVHVGINQFMDSRRIINEELRDWPLDDGRRRKLSKLAFHVAKIMVAKLMSTQRNVLVISYKVVVVSNRHVLHQNIAMELIAQRSMEELGADYGMVPATDSSVESLKIKTTSSSCEEEESCSICLENFHGGCEVVSMPCNHDFHEDCIKKWLKSSHYCPICRFQMPAKT